ncbi:MAG: hypothetical protein K6D54_05100 [Bacteroidales bacterium]|nr:hypothetical protein [Bacteroidales bacterium]
MKTWEEIEKIPFEELERMAEDNSVAVPEDLSVKTDASVRAAALAEALAGETRRRKHLRWAIPSAVAGALAAASLAVVLVLRPGEPKDTFSTPEEAYAQLEETFRFISATISRGMELATDMQPALEKTSDIINRGFEDNRE